MSRVTDVLKRLRGDALVRKVAEEVIAEVRRQGKASAEREQALTNRVRDLEARLAAVDPRLAPGAQRATIDKGEWADRAQVGELGFHVRNAGFRGDDAVWSKAIDTDWRAAGFEPTGWKGKRVLDVGAGSRLRSLWFEDAEVVVLEPLADKFRDEVPWNDFDQAVAVYSVPGEEFVPELENSIDLIVSINALDHGYDIAQSIRNLKRYLKPDGEAFLSFDMHDEPDYMHPLVLSNELMLGIYADAGFEVVKVESARRYHGAEGPGAFHYWLRHAPAAG
ncbi:MAG: methyltransferase domain-containing protein [Nocardioidaceae bacterium]|nr:methyltransferase domain-containing protein [Nocardioidaceae bacterium]